MKRKKATQTYTAEYKAQAVKMVLEEELSTNEAAKRLNMPMQTLANWVQRAKAGKLLTRQSNISCYNLVHETIKPRRCP